MTNYHPGFAFGSTRATQSLCTIHQGGNRMTINRRQFVQTLAGSAAIAAGVRPAFGQAAEFQLK